MSVPEMVLIHGRGPDTLPRIVEVDANGNLGASIVIPVGTIVGLDAGELHIGQIGGATVRASDSYTRPADTTQYAAGDQVADGTPSVLQFTVGRIVGGSGVILYALCIDSANQATKPNFRLYLFSTTPTPSADNAAWAPSDADMAALIGVVEFVNWEIGIVTAGAAGNCASIVKGLNLPFHCEAAAQLVYGLLVERGTYTPVSAEVFTLRLGAVQD